MSTGSQTKKPGRFYFDAVPEVEALLRELRGRNERWVFARPNGRRLGYRLTLESFKTAQSEAGVGPYWWHDYRRSVARRLEQSGVPRSTAMKITGHRTEQVFRQYAVGEDEGVRKALVTVLGTMPNVRPAIDARIGAASLTFLNKRPVAQLAEQRTLNP